MKLPKDFEIKEFRREFYKQLSKGKGKFQEPIDEVRYSIKIGLEMPKRLLEPETLTDYTDILEVAECKYVLKRLLQENYDYDSYFSTGTGGYYVLTEAFPVRCSGKYVWTIIVDELQFNTCYLKLMEVEEVKKNRKLDKIPFKMLAIALGVDVAYIWGFKDKIM